MTGEKSRLNFFFPQPRMIATMTSAEKIINKIRKIRARKAGSNNSTHNPEKENNRSTKTSSSCWRMKSHIWTFLMIWRAASRAWRISETRAFSTPSCRYVPNYFSLIYFCSVINILIEIEISRIWRIQFRYARRYSNLWVLYERRWRL